MKNGLLFTLMLAFALPNAEACSCKSYPPFDVYLQRHDVVFVGTVLDIDFDAAKDNRRVQFRVDRAIKGQVDSEFTVYVEVSTCAIGVAFAPTFLIFTDASGRTNQCDGSTSLHAEVNKWLETLPP